MFQIRQTDVFSNWLAGLRDVKGKARILARLDAVRLGRLGDTSNLGVGLHEMRVHFGPGYRVYYARQGKVVLLLLCGGDKSTQSRDITRARRLLKDIESE